MSWRAGALIVAVFTAALLVARLVQDTETGTATWDASRASGFAGYLLLWASVASGVLINLRFRPWGPMTWMIEVHRITSVLAAAFLVIHVMGLILDPVVHFSVIDGLVPFTSTFRPIQVGMGTLAQWLLIIVLASTALAGWMPHRLWKQIHLLSFPAFLLALLHGFTSGTDSGSTLAVGIYAGTAGSLAGIFVLRLAGRDALAAEPA
jgi:predicted ferric reductase